MQQYLHCTNDLLAHSRDRHQRAEGAVAVQQSPA